MLGILIESKKHKTYLKAPFQSAFEDKYWMALGPDTMISSGFWKGRFNIFTNYLEVKFWSRYQNSPRKINKSGIEAKVPLFHDILFNKWINLQFKVINNWFFYTKTSFFSRSDFPNCRNIWTFLGGSDLVYLATVWKLAIGITQASN